HLSRPGFRLGWSAKKTAEHWWRIESQPRLRSGRYAAANDGAGKLGNIMTAQEPTEQDLITVIVADDHPIVRSGIVAVLESGGNFRVLAEASDGLEAVQLSAELKPRV